jgi:putative Ca2+/H+ antiporter (TMEM165/GDT1 family)
MGPAPMTVIVAVFPIIFLGELPDKTMFASLVMASRGHPVAVWAGAAAAFTVHVVIAVAVGAALFAVLPHRVVDGLVSALFAAGAVYSYLIRNQEGEERAVSGGRTGWQVAGQAAVVIFVAEWGDLTQILTANLSARYHDHLAVAVGALAALWLVAAIAVTTGVNLLRVLRVRTLRLITVVVLLALAAYTAAQAAGWS